MMRALVTLGYILGRVALFAAADNNGAVTVVRPDAFLSSDADGNEVA
jgi:hypothetical protein